MQQRLPNPIPHITFPNATILQGKALKDLKAKQVELTAKQEKLAGELGDLDAQLQDAKLEISDKKAEIGDLKSKIDEIEKGDREIQKSRAKANKLEGQLEEIRQQGSLDGEKIINADSKKRMEDQLQRKLDQENGKRAKLIKNKEDAIIKVTCQRPPPGV